MTCCSSSAPDTVFVADPSRSSARHRRWKHGSKNLEHFPKQPMGPNPHESRILSSLAVCPAVPIPQEASPPDVDLTQPAAPDGRIKKARNTHGTQGMLQSLALQGFARPPRNNDQWRNGHLRLRCQSIMSSLVVHSNGDVPLCQNRDIMLGNIHRQSLDDIFNSMRSCHTQCHHSKNCNGCWINFHRKYDIILLRNLERLFPKRLIEKFYGSYQWTDDPHTTYHRYFKDI